MGGCRPGQAIVDIIATARRNRGRSISHAAILTQGIPATTIPGVFDGLPRWLFFGTMSFAQAAPAIRRRRIPHRRGSPGSSRTVKDPRAVALVGQLLLPDERRPSEKDVREPTCKTLRSWWQRSQPAASVGKIRLFAICSIRPRSPNAWPRSRRVPAPGPAMICWYYAEIDTRAPPPIAAMKSQARLRTQGP